MNKIMKSRKSYQVDEVIRSLQKKSISVSNTTVDVSNGKEIGNLTRGKIDFLCNHHGFAIIGWSKYNANNKNHVSK